MLKLYRQVLASQTSLQTLSICLEFELHQTTCVAGSMDADAGEQKTDRSQLQGVYMPGLL